MDKKETRGRPRSIKRSLKVSDVSTIISYILFLLLSEKHKSLYLNEIDRILYKRGAETGESGLRNKGYTNAAISMLENASLIIRKNQDDDKQTLYIELTDLGKEVANLMRDVEEYSKSYLALLEGMKLKIFFLRPSDLPRLAYAGIGSEDSDSEVVKDYQTGMRVLNWSKEDIPFITLQ